MEVNIENSWKLALAEEFEKPYFKQLTNFVREEYHRKDVRIFPKGSEIFRAFDDCPIDQVKVVILGQDPYPTAGHAHGLCFSCDEKVRPLPKSLVNIYKELESDLGITPNLSGNLSHWAQQGVLLLNATLTVREGQPESHAAKGWEQFTDAAIAALNKSRSNVVYMLWGSKAQQKAISVDPSRNLILKAPHPSPLSAYRGFFGSQHFSKCNAYLKTKNQSPIQW